MNRAALPLVIVLTLLLTGCGDDKAQRHEDCAKLLFDHVAADENYSTEDLVDLAIKECKR